MYAGDVDAYEVENDFGHQAEGGATCTGCHSVHGANTIGGDQGLETKILHAGSYQSELVTDLAGGDEALLTSGGAPGAQYWGVEEWREFPAQRTAFCTRCHEYYAYSSTQTVGPAGLRMHPMRRYYGWDASTPDILGLGIQVADYTTRGCGWRGCHGAQGTSGTGINIVSFPHYTPGWNRMLEGDVQKGVGSSLDDDVCLECHVWNGDTEGVGLTY